MSFRNEASNGAERTSRTLPAIQEGESPLLVNLTIDRYFEYRMLYRITSMAIRSGGLLEHCNGEIAMFAFPGGGVVQFMEEVGYRIQIRKTLVSQRESGTSVVNVRFKSGGT